MINGFASNRVILGQKIIINGVVFAEENTLKNIEVLNTEYPFTKFFDGAILVGRYGSEPFADSTEIKIGDQINLWQILNYDQKIIETGSYDKLIIKKILGK